MKISLFLHRPHIAAAGCPRRLDSPGPGDGPPHDAHRPQTRRTNAYRRPTPVCAARKQPLAWRMFVCGSTFRRQHPQPYCTICSRSSRAAGSASTNLPHNKHDKHITPVRASSIFIPKCKISFPCKNIFLITYCLLAKNYLISQHIANLIRTRPLQPIFFTI